MGNDYGLKCGELAMLCGWGVKAGWLIPLVDKCGWQVKLCDPLLTCANLIASAISITHIMKCYTNVLFTLLIYFIYHHHQFNGHLPCEP